jgi:hypothetical protein
VAGRLALTEPRYAAEQTISVVTVKAAEQSASLVIQHQ